MTLLALIALFGWIPFVAALFAILPRRMAATIAVIGAWLMLPPYGIDIAGLPDYSKNTAATLGMMLGTLLFDPGRLLRFRPRWFDWPMLLWCCCGIASSLHNGLGLYDGLSDALGQTIVWGLPYLLGRLYFGDPEGLRYFAVGMVIGGLACVPPCFFEIKMSPVLLSLIYGGAGAYDYRLGGWRPHVFFRTGLELGLWMTAVLLTAWWLWRCGALRKIGRIPFGPVLLPVLLVTTFFCRSTGALALLAIAVAVLWLSTRLRTRLFLAGLILAAPAYAVIRSTDLWSGQQAVELVKSYLGEDRAESLAYRLNAERLYTAKALEQPIFGWGGWARSAVWRNPEAPPEERKQVATDGLWIIYLGTKGIVGLTLFFLSMLLPTALFVRRFPARQWADPRLAAGSLAAALLCVYMLDCLMNGFFNIIYITLAGGLIALEPAQLGATAARGGSEAAGRRALGSAPPAAAGPPRPRPASGRVALADRCRTLARSFKQDGRTDEAEAAWRQALELLTASLQADPAAADVRRRWCDCANDLAWLQANHPDPARRDPASAAALARQAVDEFPDAAAYWNTLGAAHYRAGDVEAAVAALDRATSLGGGTAFDDVFLAMGRARLGDRDRARQDLARAMVRAERDYPGHPELAALCDEAHALLAGGAAPAPVG